MLTKIALFTAGALVATASLSFSARDDKSAAKTAGWRPGLGEIMANNQRHHAALYFAGKGANWELASFELKEIEEGFADAKAFHAMHEGVNVAELLDALGPPATKRLHEAIEKGDKSIFAEGFANLTLACNACHAGARVPYIAIIEPTAPPATNQKYDKR